MDTKTNLTKRQLAALERLFVAHIQSAEEKSEPVAIVQSKAKVFQELEHDGLAEFVTWRGFPVAGNTITVKGWVLTTKGHIAYCESCADEEIPDGAV